MHLLPKFMVKTQITNKTLKTQTHIKIDFNTFFFYQNQEGRKSLLKFCTAISSLLNVQIRHYCYYLLPKSHFKTLKTQTPVSETKNQNLTRIP